jgi:hypothetical protein
MFEAGAGSSLLFFQIFDFSGLRSVCLQLRLNARCLGVGGEGGRHENLSGHSEDDAEIFGHNRNTCQEPGRGGPGGACGLRQVGF